MAAVAPDAGEEIPGMSDQDQIIDAVMARAIQADAARTHPLLAWIVMQDEITYPGQFVARLVTDDPTRPSCSARRQDLGRAAQVTA
jgi:hypothetical protein